MTAPVLPIVPLDDEVIVWSKPGCVQCTATYRALDSKDIPYRKLNVLEHPEAIKALKDADLLQMPAVQFGDEVWSGFQPDKINEVHSKLAKAA